jgi:Putative transposase
LLHGGGRCFHREWLVLRFRFFESEEVNMAAYIAGDDQLACILKAHEFFRRFLLHVLPKGFVRIRFFGLLANRRRRTWLTQGQRILTAQSETHSRPTPTPPTVSNRLCPLCGGAMVVVERLTAEQIAVRTAGLQGYVDTS